ncbi:hypothetical protein PGB90_002077 [Kerria lacca]
MTSYISVILKSTTLQKIFPNLNSIIRNKIFLSSVTFNTDINEPQNSSELSNNVLANNNNNEGEQFRYLLRNSAFINLGDPKDKTVVGKIFHVVENDLYIDFGWKFYCVCSRPTKNGKQYIRGSEVLLKIKDLELSTEFLGSTTGLTLLEADAFIIKLLKSPLKETS